MTGYRPRPVALNPGKRHGTIYMGGWVGLGSVGKDAEYLTPKGIRSPDHLSVASRYTACAIAAHIYYEHPTTHKIHCAGTTKFLILERSVHIVTTVTKVVIVHILFLHMDCTLRVIRFKVETLIFRYRVGFAGRGSAHHPLGKLIQWKMWAKFQTVTRMWNYGTSVQVKLHGTSVQVKLRYQCSSETTVLVFKWSKTVNLVYLTK
jgi:hypothetical protein